MRDFSSIIYCTKTSAFVVTTLLVLPGRHAAADNLLGLYVGGAIGQAQVEASAPFTTIAIPSPGEFKENHSAYKFMVGIRPISSVGAEVEYLNFGNPSGTTFTYPANASIKGEAAFGMLYLPIPVIDIYVKAGLARLKNDLRGYYPIGDNICEFGQPCGTAPFESNRTNTTFAAGAGAQFKVGSWAVRAEYERFNSADEHPNLVSLGLTWSF